MENYTDPDLNQLKNIELNARQVSYGQYQYEKDERLAPIELNPREQELADTTYTVRLITAAVSDTLSENFATDSSVLINEWAPNEDGSYLINVIPPDGEKIPERTGRISRLDRGGLVRDIDDNEVGYFLKDNGLFGRFEELFESALLPVEVKREELEKSVQAHEVEQPPRTIAPTPRRWLI